MFEFDVTKEDHIVNVKHLIENISLKVDARELVILIIQLLNF